jgi:hypothetical protein
VVWGQRGKEPEACTIMPPMNELALPLTHYLRLPTFFEEEIGQRHI